MRRSAFAAVVAAALITGAALAVTEHTVDIGSGVVTDTVRAGSERLHLPTALRSTRRPINAKGRPVIIKAPGQTKPSEDLEPKNTP